MRGADNRQTPTQAAAQWRRKYEAATKESDRKKLTALVHEAEFAIAERLQQIHGSRDAKTEHRALKNAVAELYRIQVELLGYPDWKNSLDARQNQTAIGGSELMLPPLDIFRITADGEPLWVEAAATFDAAKERAKQLMKSSAMEYMIFSQRTGNRVSLKAEARQS